MIKQKRKIVSLLDELLYYALQADPQKVVVTIEDQEGEIRITVEDDGAQRSEEECRQAECILNAPCRNEMKDYYSGLAGEETVGLGRLQVVGMMIDGARVEPGDKGTRLSVWWAQQ
ncbi:MAG: sensor histidine kinase [Anaerolineae bacterium]|nr:sensor histidine kinase [Anaerolineae bacterium]